MPPITAPTDDIMVGTSFSITVGEPPVVKPISVTDTSLQGVVNAINKTPDLGVKATAFQVSPGKYTMQISSTTVGALSKFDLGSTPFSGLGEVQVVSEGTDAELSVGDSATPLKVT